MTMNNAFKELFSPIQAEETLKDHTKEFLAEQTQGYTRVRAVKRKYHFYAAVCVCFLVMLFGGRWLYFTPIAAISIDINPSMEMGINRFDRVISVTGFNEEGRKLSSMPDVKYKNYTDAIEQILQDDSIAVLLSDDEIMTITVIGPNGQQSEKILSGVEACTMRQGNAYCYFVTPEEVASAHETGLSCGKYRAFLELQLLDPDITPEAVQNMTMREIRELIDSLSVNSETDTSSYRNQGHGHHGHGGSRGNRWRNKRMADTDMESP